MSEKTKKSLKIVSQEEIGKDIYSICLLYTSPSPRDA